MSYGIKISKPGFDVFSADDKDLIFNSERNSPKIYAQGQVTIAHTAGDTNHTIYTHNLGYFPAHRVYFEYPAGSNKFYGDNGFFGNGAFWSVKTSTSKIELDTSNFLPTGNYKVYYIVFADPAKSTTVKLTPTENIGIKISKPGKDSDSDDLKDFVLHSNYMMPNILDVITLQTTTSNETVSVAHNLGITPAWSGTMAEGSFWYDLPYIIMFAASYEVWVTSTHVYARTFTIAANVTRTYKITLFNIDLN